MSSDIINSLTEYDKCSINKIMNLIRPKWTMEIILELIVAGNNSLAFSDFEKLITGINPRILSTRLASLSKKGIIDRIVPDPKTPKKVRYKLSAKGFEFLNVLLAMRSWAVKHLDVKEECARDECRHMLVIKEKYLKPQRKREGLMLDLIAPH